MNASSDRGAVKAPVTRASGKRTALVDVLAASEDFRSAQDIHELMRGTEQQIGLATVYRTLQAMNAAGELDTPG